MTKNFNELDVICHVGKSATKTLVPAAAFYYSTKEDDLPFREPSLSRLDMSLITKAGDKTDVFVFNIPAKEINELRLKTDIAVTKLMTESSNCVDAPSQSADGFAGSPAFSVQLMLNAFRGRTPGDVLSADPSKKNDLLKGKEWLEANLAKYPANQKQIDAINDAVKLLEIGELTAGTATSSKSESPSVLTIYKKEFKYKSKKDDAGNSLVYSVCITCDPTRNMPFTVDVMNCFAPVITNGNGQTIVKTAAAVNTKRASIALSDSEWIGFVCQAYDLYQNFKRCNAANAFNRAAKNSYNQN